jgi:hypothetical protein
MMLSEDVKLEEYVMAKDVLAFLMHCSHITFCKSPQAA